MEIRALTISTDYSYKEELQAECLSRNILVDYTGCMTEAIDMIAKIDYCLVVIRADTIDYMDGLKMITKIKHMPILIFSFEDSDDKISALQSGAQVYISTTFNPEYLVEMCTAMAKYYVQLKEDINNTDPTVFTHNYLALFVEPHQVFYKEKRIDLSKKEFDLLQYFMMNKGMTLTYDQILNTVWGDEHGEHINVVHSLIRRLRHKIQCDIGIDDFITSVRELGYKFGTSPSRDG